MEYLIMQVQIETFCEDLEGSGGAIELVTPVICVNACLNKFLWIQFLLRCHTSTISSSWRNARLSGLLDGCQASLQVCFFADLKDHCAWKFDSRLTGIGLPHNRARPGPVADGHESAPSHPLIFAVRHEGAAPGFEYHGGR